MKLRKTFNGNLKAVSPVIATIIIVAIAITMSIAVAYWLLGLGASFTKFEKVEFTTAYVNTGTYGNGTNYFQVVMDLKNTGTADATIDPSLILYNGKPASAYAQVPVPSFTMTTLQPGKSATGLKIDMQNVASGTWSSGMTVEVMIHTTAGKDYPKVITLP